MSDVVRQPETTEQPQMTVVTSENEQSQVVPQMAVVTAEPTMYDTHVKENFHVFGLASFLYACLYAFCMYKNDAGITYTLLVAGGAVFYPVLFKKIRCSDEKRKPILYGKYDTVIHLDFLHG